MFLLNKSNFAKYAIFCISSVLLLIALGLVINGFNVFKIFCEFEPFLMPEFIWLPLSHMILGSICIIFSFCTCWANLKESYCTIFIFFIFLAVTSLLALAVGIFCYLLGPHIEPLITYPMNTTLHLYNPNQVNVETVMWDYLQKTFTCCGLSNYRDWQNLSHQWPPLSCCSVPNGIMGNFSCTYEMEDANRHGFGCLSNFSFYIQSQLTTLGNAGIIITLTVFIGIILISLFSRSFKNPYTPTNDAERIYYLSK